MTPTRQYMCFPNQACLEGFLLFVFNRVLYPSLGAMGLGLGGKRDAHSSLQNLNHARPCDVDDNVGPATPAQKLAVVPPGMESTRRPIAPAAPNEHAHRIAKRAGPSANRAATRGALACDGQIFHPGHRAKLMYVNLHPPRSDPHHHPTPP